MAQMTALLDPLSCESVTLLFAGRNESRNYAVAVKERLEDRRRQQARPTEHGVR